MTAAERRLRGRAGAFAMLARNDPRETSKAGRDAVWQGFQDQVDPDRVLPEAERDRRAEAARKSRMSSIALLSVQARAAKRGRRSSRNGSAEPEGAVRHERLAVLGDPVERPLEDPDPVPVLGVLGQESIELLAQPQQMLATRPSSDSGLLAASPASRPPASTRARGPLSSRRPGPGTSAGP